MDVTTQKLVIPCVYDDIGNFGEGLAPVKSNGRWSYVNLDNVCVIDFDGQLIDASEFKDGLAVVKTTRTSYLIKNPVVASGVAPTPTAPTAPTTERAPKAAPTTSAVLVDGEEIPFDAYNIADNNYFKLRDIAQILSGTDAQFEVEWDGEREVIRLITEKEYTPVGGEMVAGAGTAQAYSASDAAIDLDGKEVSLTAYTIRDNNYFKLRDLGETLDFNVSWDKETGNIVVASDESYSAD